MLCVCLLPPQKHKTKQKLKGLLHQISVKGGRQDVTSVETLMHVLLGAWGVGGLLATSIAGCGLAAAVKTGSCRPRSLNGRLRGWTSPLAHTPACYHALACHSRVKRGLMAVIPMRSSRRAVSMHEEVNHLKSLLVTKKAAGRQRC